MRQGFPLLPLLFLIVAEGLSRALLVAKRLGKLKGIRMVNSIFLTHLLFVDDILLFCDDFRRDALKFKVVLDLYCIATGMMVYIAKSTISFAGIHDEDVNVFLELFPYQRVELQDGLKYLRFFIKRND
jgi:hypothetical protein